MTTFVADRPTAFPPPPPALPGAKQMLRAGPVVVTPPARASQKAKPKPKRSRRCFYALLATRDEIRLPRYQALGYLEQSRLIQRAQAGDIAAKQTVWLRNARLAYSAANRYRSRRDLMADRVQEAQLGIGRSIDLFKVELLFAFSTYAFTSISHRLVKHIGDTAFATRIPVALQFPYLKFRRRVANAPNRAAWFDARDAFLDDSPSRYANLLRIHAIAEPGPLVDAADVQSPETAPHEALEQAETRDLVRKAVDNLEPRFRQVILKRYGIWDCPTRTLEEIGDGFGLTRERIRQMQVQAEGMLREALYHAVLGTKRNEASLAETNQTDLKSATPPSPDPAEGSHATDHYRDTILRPEGQAPRALRA